MSVGEGQAGSEDGVDPELDLEEELISLDYLDEVCVCTACIMQVSNTLYREA